MIEEKFMNPQALTSIFGNIPLLEGAELLDIQLKREEPILSVTLMTKEAVKSKPKRWDQWDVVYIQLSFLTIRNLEIKGWGKDNIISRFEISGKTESNALIIKGVDGLQINTNFEWIKVERVIPGLIGSP